MKIFRLSVFLMIFFLAPEGYSADFQRKWQKICTKLIRPSSKKSLPEHGYLCVKKTSLSPRKNSFSYRVLIVGDEEAGKSTLVEKLNLEEHPLELAEVPMNFQIIEHNRKTIYERTIPYRLFNGIIIAFDITKAETLDRAGLWLNDVEHYTEGIPIILAATKCDTSPLGSCVPTLLLSDHPQRLCVFKTLPKEVRLLIAKIFYDLSAKINFLDIECFSKKRKINCFNTSSLRNFQTREAFLFLGKLMAEQEEFNKTR